MKTDKMRLLEHERGDTLENLLRGYFAQGLNDGEIADRLGISRQTFYCWLDLMGATVTRTRVVSFNNQRDAVTA